MRREGKRGDSEGACKPLPTRILQRAKREKVVGVKKDLQRKESERRRKER